MSAPATAAEPVLTVKQVAEHLQVSADAVYALVADGAIRSIRVGRLVRVPQSSLVAFVEGGGGL